MIERPVKLYVGDRPTFLTFFYVFFQISKKKHDCLRFLSFCARFLEHWKEHFRGTCIQQLKHLRRLVCARPTQPIAQKQRRHIAAMRDVAPITLIVWIFCGYIWRKHYYNAGVSTPTQSMHSNGDCADSHLTKSHFMFGLCLHPPWTRTHARTHAGIPVYATTQSQK